MDQARSKQKNRTKGNFIETQAVAFLKRLGYEILARNYAFRGGKATQSSSWKSNPYGTTSRATRRLA